MEEDCFDTWIAAFAAMPMLKRIDLHIWEEAKKEHEKDKYTYNRGSWTNKINQQKYQLYIHQGPKIQ